MEFKNIGVIPYDPPSDDLKSFFRRKFATNFRNIDRAKAGVIYRQQALIWADRASNFFKDPKEKLAVVTKQMKAYDKCVFFGKDRVTEKEYVDELTRRTFSDPEERKKYMDMLRDGIEVWFEPIDANRDGVIDEKEFFAFYEFYENPVDTTKAVFDHIDVNKDGVISLEEFSYGMISWIYKAGPDDLYSLWGGPLLKDYEYRE